MLLSLFTFFLYVPLFLVSFVLAIVAMAQGRTGNGIIMLIATLLIPPSLWLAIFAVVTGPRISKVSQTQNTTAKVPEMQKTTPKASEEQKTASELKKAALSNITFEECRRLYRW